MGMFSVNEREIIGLYKKENVVDADSIYMAHNAQIKAHKMIKYMGIASMFAGLLFIICMVPIFFVIGPLVAVLADPGIGLISMGFWCVKSFKKKCNVVENATKIYCEELGIKPISIL